MRGQHQNQEAQRSRRLAIEFLACNSPKVDYEQKQTIPPNLLRCCPSLLACRSAAVQNTPHHALKQASQAYRRVARTPFRLSVHPNPQCSGFPRFGFAAGETSPSSALCRRESEPREGHHHERTGTYAETKACGTNLPPHAPRDLPHNVFDVNWVFTDRCYATMSVSSFDLPSASASYPPPRIGYALLFFFFAFLFLLEAGVKSVCASLPG
jgi:hypothetical protein